MKTRSTPPLPAAQREALEARFALRVSARLEEGAQAVPHDIAERLRVAREQALRAARESRLALAPSAAPVSAPISVGLAGLSGVGATGSQIATGPGLLGPWQPGRLVRTPGHGRRLEEAPTPWGWRLAALLPAVALVLGLWGVQRYAKQEQVEAATEVDMQLLTDDLPPDAYADPGFEEFLSRDVDPVRPIDYTLPELGEDLGEIDNDVPASAIEF